MWRTRNGPARGKIEDDNDDEGVEKKKSGMKCELIEGRAECGQHQRRC